MFERFTDRARRVVVLAQEEARMLSHNYIGTEHILLGLIQEGSGVAANVLRNLDVDPEKIRVEVEKIVQDGPTMVTMGQLPFTPRAKKVLELAARISADYADCDDLLLVGILQGSFIFLSDLSRAPGAHSRHFKLTSLQIDPVFNYPVRALH